ncbi:hypothetical protein F53441_2418 [Fusarium austroafricanum]|uniref:Mitochondrial import inner membrane translocase subunit TIM50 n=1 Tax=Fusarium austroafricanum TaxID=2364996 RepID=A0A8H4P302_9HYPO|nr:hypothetical protein F53441_2418 [Fusarium austroafricanum]
MKGYRDRDALPAVPTSQSASQSASQPTSKSIPGLTLAQQKTSDSLKNAPRGPRSPKNSQPASKSLPPKPRILIGPKAMAKAPSTQQEVRRSQSPPRTPTKASGGVPDPTPQYIAQAKLSPERLPQPRRILIIMDLNGTLLHRPNKRRPFNFVERPHAKTFLKYCLEAFHVAIWSSARPENVNRMVEQLLTPEQREQCLVIWGRDYFGLSEGDYNAKVQVYKRLTTVWTNPRVMAAHPQAHKGGLWDQSNTILVDDSFEKGRSEPFNLLTLPEFSGLATETPNVLPQVHDYLNELAHQADISRFVRQSPFKLDPSYILPDQSA